MPLNLLPYLFIRSSFNNLKSKARGALTIALFNYVENFWIKHSIWKPKIWSSFNVAIRTYSPVEGYHARLKRMAKRPHVNLYLLLELLWVQADQVPFPCFLLANDKLGTYKKTRFPSRRHYLRYGKISIKVIIALSIHSTTTLATLYPTTTPMPLTAIFVKINKLSIVYV